MRSFWRDGDRVREVELSALGPGKWQASVDGAAQEVAAEPLGNARLRLMTSSGVVAAEVTIAGSQVFVHLGTMDFVFQRERSARKGTRAGAGAGLEAPMPGVVTKVLVADGDEVRKGQPLVTLEAMKMEHVIRAPRDGRIKRIAAKTGEMVGSGVELVELES